MHRNLKRRRKRNRRGGWRNGDRARRAAVDAPGAGMHVRAVPWGAPGWGVDGRVGTGGRGAGERGEVWRRWRGGEWSDFFCASLVGRESCIAVLKLADGVGQEAVVIVKIGCIRQYLTTDNHSAIPRDSHTLLTSASFFLFNHPR